MNWKIFFVLLFSSQMMLSQGNRADSLKNEIKTTSDNLQLVSLKNQLALELRHIDSDSALLFAKEASELAVKIQDLDGQISALHNIGLILSTREQKDSSRIFLGKARALAKESKDQLWESNILKEYANTFNTITEKDSVLFFLKASLDVSRMLGDRDEEFQTLNQIGKTYKYNAFYLEAENYFLEALELQKKIGRKMFQAGILQNLGNTAGEANDLDKANAYYQEALEIMEAIENREGKAMILSLIAYTYMQKGYYPQSLEYYQKSLNIFDENEANGIYIQDLRGMGAAYEGMENYPKALTYYLQALKIKEKLDGNADHVDLLNDIGRNNFFREEYETAIQYYRKALQILQRQRASELKLAGTYVHLGSSFERLNQLDSADHYLQIALKTLKLNKQFKTYASGLISLGKVYRKQGKIELAKKTFDEAFVLSEASGYMQFEMETAEELYQIFNAEKNHERALHYFITHQKFKDQIFNVKNMERIVRLEAEFEVQKEKQKIAFEREKELAQQRSFKTILIIALAGAFLIILIITLYSQQKRKANKELLRLNSEVSQQKEKLEELDHLKSHFFTNISHEFRTPLTIISGMIDQVKSKPELWLEKGSQMIKHNTVNLLKLVNQILELRKLESGGLGLDLVQGDIIQYLRYITTSYGTYAENNGIKLHFLSAPSSLKMDYDPDKMLRVISNLLSNAVKFTPDGGDIYFHIDEKKDDQTRLLHIRIQDTGTGIPKGQLKHVFERFYQVDDYGIHKNSHKQEGSGIGLALTQEFVKLMGGKISVESEVGSGSTFSIFLPITNNSAITDSFSSIDDHALAPTEEITNKESQLIVNTNMAKPVLLIVEDNIDVQELLIACLQDDYQLLIEPNGQKGIDTAINQIPDIIISDVMMPVKDGIELCETLKKDERTSHIPIILLTAKADIDSRISGLEKGADDYLAKPFEHKELLVRLHNLLEQRKKLQERYRTLEAIGNDIQEDNFIQKVRKAIEKNMDDDGFGVMQLCREVALSRAQLHNKIKALTGMPTAAFIRTIRLKRAKYLLDTTDLNVSEIAFEVGFKSASYFSTAFLEEFGITPSKTRK